MEFSSGYSQSHRESLRGSGRVAGTGGADKLSNYRASLDQLITSDEKCKDKDMQQKSMKGSRRALKEDINSSTKLIPTIYGTKDVNASSLATFGQQG